MNALIGKTITRVWLAEDSQALKFDVAEGDSVKVLVDADCCSETWIESLDTPELLIGGKVIAVEDLEMPDLGDIEGREVIAYYGCKIVTDKGSCVIDYRNDSNGYYGGNLSWPEDTYFYGGVYGQNVSKENWKEAGG